MLVPKNCFSVIGAAVMALVAIVASPTLHAADTGTLVGRVQNTATGDYIEHARLTVGGTTLEVLTEATGEYRINNVPAGAVSVHVFYTGLQDQVASVTVTAGAVTRQDFQLRPIDQKEITVLDPFQVAASRDMNGQAIAINEQRFSPKIENVVSSDTFGQVADGDFALFLKFIPGVNLSYTGYNVSGVSVRGIPSAYTLFLVDGNPSTTAGTSRTFNPETLLLNDVARVEVTKSATSDVPANAIGGTINVITKTAFEQSKPTFDYRTYANFNSQSANWGDIPGPNAHTSGWHVRPNGDFSMIVPLSDKLGFTLGGLWTSRFIPAPNYLPSWSPASTNQAIGTITNPALVSLRAPSNPAIQERWSISFGLDWKFAQYDTLRFRVTQEGNEQNNDQVQTIPSIGATAPVAYDATMTQGAAGKGTVSFNTTAGEATAPKIDTSLTWLHNGPIWKMDAGGSFSRASFKRRDLDEGVFGTTSAVLRNVTVGFQNIQANKPGQYTVTSATGTPVLGNGNDVNAAGLVSASTTQYDQPSTESSAHLNVSRDLDLAFPETIKIGGLFTSDKRDTPYYDARTYTFVGPDGVAGSADDVVSNYNLVASSYSGQKMPWGLPSVNWPSNEKFALLFKQHPEYFTYNQATEIAAVANTETTITEQIASAYFRSDTKLFNNKLWIVAGVRYENTDDNGYGVLNNPAATYQHDASGKIITNAAGAPVLITGTAADLAKLQYTIRGTHLDHDDGAFYPSVNATFNLLDNLLLRGAAYRTIGRPDFGNLLPSTVVSAPGAVTNTITVNNTGLKPWSSNNFDFSVEYYPTGNNVITAGVFQKYISNFFGATSQVATPALLSQFGLDQSYVGYQVNTLTNVGTAQISGVELNVVQSLAAVADQLKGFSMFANTTQLDLSGPANANFTGFAPRTINWGLSHTGKYDIIQLNWNYNGRARTTQIVGASIQPGTYFYTAPWLDLDLSAELRIFKHQSFFIGVRNLTNASTVTQAYGPSTPSYAKMYQTSPSGAIFNMGIKGSF